jgi:hypothetical protein
MAGQADARIGVCAAIGTAARWSVAPSRCLNQTRQGIAAAAAAAGVKCAGPASGVAHESRHLGEQVLRQALAIILLAFAVLAAAPRVAAQQEGDEAVPPATAPQPLSVQIRAAGFTVTDQEAAYLDADAQFTDQFVAPMLTVELHAPFVSDDFSHQVVLSQLQQVANLDPNGNTVQPPPSLAELERIQAARRASIRQAAQQWLAALQANDPNWVMAGSDAYGAARQGEADWYAALRQRLAGASGGGR